MEGRRLQNKKERLQKSNIEEEYYINNTKFINKEKYYILDKKVCLQLIMAFIMLVFLYGIFYL